MGADIKVGRPKAGDFSDPITGELNELGLKLTQTAAGLGIPMAEIAVLLGMSERTFFDRRKKFPEIDLALLEGEAESSFRVSNALMKRCIGGDMAAIRWFEMTRKGRSEKTEQSVNLKSYVVAAPPLLSEDEWVAENSPNLLPEGEKQ